GNFSISEIIGKNNLALHFFKNINDYTSCKYNVFMILQLVYL
ncbi:MAG: hypothetical protein ACI8Q1_001103, partial [Parvicella sp.]